MRETEEIQPAHGEGESEVPDNAVALRSDDASMFESGPASTAKLLRRIVQDTKLAQRSLTRNIDKTTKRLVAEQLRKKVTLHELSYVFISSNVLNTVFCRNGHFGAKSRCLIVPRISAREMPRTRAAINA